MHPGEARLVRDELVDAVDHNGQTRSVVVGGSPEAGACLKTRAFDIDGFGDVKEPRLLPDLSQVGLTEGLLHYDVE